MSEKSRNKGPTIERLYTALVKWQAAHVAACHTSRLRAPGARRLPTEDELFAVLNRHPWGMSEEGDRLAEQLCMAVDERIPSLLLLGGSCQ